MKTLLISIAAFTLVSSLTASHAQAEGAKNKFFVGAAQAKNFRTNAAYPTAYVGIKARVNSRINYRFTLQANEKALGRACYLKDTDEGSLCLRVGGYINYHHNPHVTIRFAQVGNESSLGMEYTF